jgi:uncharacterized protein (DUF1499 family)
MRRLKWPVLLALLGAAGWAYTAWPVLNEVETGRTPEYSDLQPRSYGVPPEQVVAAVKGALARLPRWQLVGSGSGPGGARVDAVHATLVWGFEEDVTVKVTREAGRTKVSVRSKSRIGQADFGQNARNVRELLAALDAAAGPGRLGPGTSPGAGPNPR